VADTNALAQGGFDAYNRRDGTPPETWGRAEVARVRDVEPETLECCRPSFINCGAGRAGPAPPDRRDGAVVDRQVT